MNIFRGYIPSKGKVPLESVKTTVLLKEPMADHDYVGVLREDIIQLDFDSEDVSDLVLKVVNTYKLKCNILKTSRGVHLYFKNDDYTKSQSVGIYNAMGMKCDVGLGTKDRVVPLRVTNEKIKTQVVNGVEKAVVYSETVQRDWLQTYEELDVIPPFFRPFSKTDFSLNKTETRNQTLFDYILRLQLHAFTKDEVRKTIKAINQFVLYEPLADKEIDIITRDEAFSEELFYDKKNFLHHRFGDYMLANHHIVMIDNRPHIFTESKLYSDDPNEFEKQMLLKIPSLKDSQRKEVYKYISLKVKRKAEFMSPKYLGLKDTVLDVQTYEEQLYTPNVIINNKIDYSYNPNAYHELMDRTLNKVCNHDPQIRAVLEEMIGYTLYRSSLLQSCFILTGEGSNGKSTILNVIKKLLGKQNYTSLDLRELEDTFKPSELYNKLANIGDDISSKYIESSSVFKKVVTGESFIVQKKFAQPFELESYATQIFCANEMPQINDKSDGFSRRIIIIPFNAKFSTSDADYDPFIEEKLLTDEALEYLLKISIDALRRILISKKFTKSDKGEMEKNEYLIFNDNTLEWLETEPKIENESINDVYLAYTVWCSRSGTHAVKKNNLGRSIKKKLGLEGSTRRINGVPTKVYAK
jgi:putative DNA primase/helicase